MTMVCSNILRYIGYSGVIYMSRPKVFCWMGCGKDTLMINPYFVYLPGWFVYMQLYVLWGHYFASIVWGLYFLDPVIRDLCGACP